MLVFMVVQEDSPAPSEFRMAMFTICYKYPPPIPYTWKGYILYSLMWLFLLFINNS